MATLKVLVNQPVDKEVCTAFSPLDIERSPVSGRDQSQYPPAFIGECSLSRGCVGSHQTVRFERDGSTQELVAHFFKTFTAEHGACSSSKKPVLSVPQSNIFVHSSSENSKSSIEKYSIADQDTLIKSLSDKSLALELSMFTFDGWSSVLGLNISTPSEFGLRVPNEDFHREMPDRKSLCFYYNS